MKNMQFHILFPKVMGDIQLPDLIKPVSKIIKNCKEWNVDTNKNEQTQSENIFVLNDYPEIQQIFTTTVQNFLKDIMKTDCNIQMSTSWITRAEPNVESHWHDPHTSWWSACYYPYPNCKIGFDANDPSQFLIQPTVWTGLNSTLTQFSPSAGTLYVFPSKLLHKGLLNETKKIRYSLAFNFMPLGLHGHRDSTFNFK